MQCNVDSVNVYNQMIEMGYYYDSGRPVRVDSNIIKEDILSKLPIKKEDVVLDVGCGTGWITIPLSKHCKFIHALDAGSKVIERPRNEDIRKTFLILLII